MSLPLDLLVSVRPRQWTKNFFVFAALLFSRNLLVGRLAARSLLAFGLFCLASGAVYLVNDTLDRERDRAHPLKARRPIASGRVPASLALIGAVVLAIVALGCSHLLGMPFVLTLLAYVVVQVAYSVALKHIVILDVFAVAVGFVLRVVAGALAIDVGISSWLLVCTILLALFLALCKRRHEFTTLAADAPAHRSVLAEYDTGLLDQMITVTAAAAVIGYCLYTMSDETVQKFGTANLVFTSPFVIYGLFRYLYLVRRRSEGGSPEQTLMTDVPLLLCVLLWAAASGLILYR